MGYSSRYHAASLAAVFIALAVGILIGIGLADDVVTTASEELEQALRSQLEDAEREAEERGLALEREREFAEAALPALVSGRLEGTSVALLGLGGLRQGAAEDVRAAIEPAGAALDAVAAVPLPPDARGLADAAGRSRAAVRRPEGLRRLGRALGAGMAGGSRLIDRVRGTVFSRFSGSLEDVDFVVVAPVLPDELEAEEQARVDAFVGGVLQGAREGSVGAVAVERSDAEQDALGVAAAEGVTTVDHVELTAGRVALVHALLGAEGRYGVKEGADRFLPELLATSPDGAQQP